MQYRSLEPPEEDLTLEFRDDGEGNPTLFAIKEGDPREFTINLDEVDYALIEIENGNLSQLRYNGETISFDD